MIGDKYNLPSKNYIANWEQYLKKKGLLPLDATKPVKTVGRAIGQGDGSVVHSFQDKRTIPPSLFSCQ